MMHEDFWFEQELKQMEKRITENVIKEVLARIQIDADASNAILEIEKIQKALNNFAK